MRQNSISYPGERPAKRADIVEQPGYAGKHYFVVNYAGRRLEVQKRNEMAYCKYQLWQGQPGHAPNADCQGLPAE
jgi:hypothetical protein